MNTHKKMLEAWEVETNILAHEFARKYFGKCSDIWWIAEQVGGVLVVNDYYFNLDRILDALHYKATRKQLFDYYELELEVGMKKKFKEKSVTEMIGYNFKNYLKMK